MHISPPLSRQSQNKKLRLAKAALPSTALALTLGLFVATAGATLSYAQESGHSHETEKPPRQSWSFAGPFGKFDTAQLQRGYQVYQQVCSNCHAMHLVAFRNLAQPGGPSFTPEQVKALAATYKVKDGPNESGEMFERPGRASDMFPWTFANEQAARAANGGALPPDMSVLAKARSYERGFPLFLVDVVTQYQEHGVDYITALLNGYEEPPAGMAMLPGQYYNKYMPGNRIAMPKPLSDGLVDYTDGSPKTAAQYSKDVAAFLMWAAEPQLDQRKKFGTRAILFLAALAGLLFYTKKKIWANLEKREA